MSLARDPKRYQRTKITLHLFQLTVFAAAMGVLVALREGVAATIESLTAYRWLGLLAFEAVLFVGFEILTLPLSWYEEFRVEHTYGLSNQTTAVWIRQSLKAWLIGAVLTGFFVAAIYAPLWYGGRFWWAWMWVGWLALMVGLARLFPVVIVPLMYKTEPLESPSLQERIRRLAEGARFTISGVYKIGLSEETKKANAALTGLGATRRVLLSDTLLEAFTEDEIATVVAHELGHHIHGHIAKSLALMACVNTVAAAAVALVLSPHAGVAGAAWPAAVAQLPAVALAVMLSQLAMAPLTNWIQRVFERQSDREALSRTGLPEAFRSAMQRIGEMNLADPDPPRWMVVLFHDHPPLRSRMAMADAWRESPPPVGAGGALG